MSDLTLQSTERAEEIFWFTADIPVGRDLAWWIANSLWFGESLCSFESSRRDCHVGWIVNHECRHKRNLFPRSWLLYLYSSRGAPYYSDNFKAPRLLFSRWLWIYTRHLCMRAPSSSQTASPLWHLERLLWSICHESSSLYADLTPFSMKPDCIWSFCRYLVSSRLLDTIWWSRQELVHEAGL